MNKVIEVDFLPREPQPEAFRPRSMPNARHGTSPSEWRTFGVREERRILIVDNDRDTTHLVKILLEKTGRYSVLELNDATRAHLSAQNFRPDLILLDVMMPGTDGGEVAAQIEADPDLQRTPIIFLTALVTKAEASAGLRIQGHRFLAKPVNIPELITAIEENLAAAAPVLS